MGIRIQAAGGAASTFLTSCLTVLSSEHHNGLLTCSCCHSLSPPLAYSTTAQAHECPGARAALLIGKCDAHNQESCTCSSGCSSGSRAWRRGRGRRGHQQSSSGASSRCISLALRACSASTRCHMKLPREASWRLFKVHGHEGAIPACRAATLCHMKPAGSLMYRCTARPAGRP